MDNPNSDSFDSTIPLYSLKYIGGNIMGLVIIGFICIIMIGVVEKFGDLNFRKNEIDQKPNDEIKDLEVKKEIERVKDSGLTDYSIKIQNLQKNYGGMCSQGVKAIKGLSLGLQNGECFALLGLNGAGKSTTFKCLTSEVKPSNGQIYINGHNLEAEFDIVRNQIGYCPQFDAIFDHLSVEENLTFYALIKGIPRKIVNI